jgi:glyoxylase-like metal-dependent hydrolase (beta-lactamase superfamily II)
MRAYVATLHRLRDEFAGARTLYGGHGQPVRDPRAKLDEYIAHRAARERQILTALGVAARTIPELVAELYADVPHALWPAAGRQVLASLIALEREGVVRGQSLERTLTHAERDILYPDVSSIADPQLRAVASAELGYGNSANVIQRFRSI